MKSRSLKAKMEAQACQVSQVRSSITAQAIREVWKISVLRHAKTKTRSTSSVKNSKSMKRRALSISSEPLSWTQVKASVTLTLAREAARESDFCRKKITSRTTSNSIKTHSTSRDSSKWTASQISTSKSLWIRTWVATKKTWMGWMRRKLKSYWRSGSSKWWAAQLFKTTTWLALVKAVGNARVRKVLGQAVSRQIHSMLGWLAAMEWKFSNMSHLRTLASLVKVSNSLPISM